MDYSDASNATDFHRLPHLDLIRVGTAGKITGVVTSLSIWEPYTHFYRGKTVGCARENCPACRDKVPKRYEAYLGVYSPATRRHVILGLTVNAVRQIVEQVGRKHRIRGLVIEVTRKGKKANGKVNVATSHLWPDTSTLPSAPDLIAHLERIWGVDHVVAVAGEEGLREHIDHATFPILHPTLEDLHPDRYCDSTDAEKDDLEGQMHFPS